MLYMQFYILLRAHEYSADTVLCCVELFSLMLVLLLYERAHALFESHCITILYSQLSMSQTLLFQSRFCFEEFSLDTFTGSICFVDPFIRNR